MASPKLTRSTLTICEGREMLPVDSGLLTRTPHQNHTNNDSSRQERRRPRRNNYTTIGCFRIAAVSGRTQYDRQQVDLLTSPAHDTGRTLSSNRLIAKSAALDGLRQSATRALQRHHRAPGAAGSQANVRTGRLKGV